MKATAYGRWRTRPWRCRGIGIECFCRCADPAETRTWLPIFDLTESYEVCCCQPAIGRIEQPNRPQCRRPQWRHPQPLPLPMLGAIQGASHPQLPTLNASAFSRGRIFCCRAVHVHLLYQIDSRKSSLATIFFSVDRTTAYDVSDILWRIQINPSSWEVEKAGMSSIDGGNARIRQVHSRT